MLGPVEVDCDSKVIPVQKAIDWALGEAILREIGQHDIAHASYLTMRRVLCLNYRSLTETVFSPTQTFPTNVLLKAIPSWHPSWLPPYWPKYT